MSRNKTITKGKEAREKVVAGVNKAADAVAPTLGPVGLTALIEYPGLDPITADDGVTVLRNLQFEDRHENMGLALLKKGAMRSSAEGGDGTATTTVLTRAFLNEAMDEVGDDSSKIREVRDRLDKGLVEALKALKDMSVPVKDEDLERIAEVSSLDPEVAKLIAEVIREVGPTGAITVEKGAKLGLSHEVVKGMRFDRGLISPFFINDHENAQTVLEDAYVVLVDRTIASNEQIVPLLNSIGTGKHILFIATDIQGVALGTLAKNAMAGIASIACVQNPYNATPARDFLFDLAAITGATVISEEMGMRLEEATKEQCGRAEKIVITRDNTTVIGGKGDTATRVKELEGKLDKSVSEFGTAQLKDRIAALTGGIGVIRVGAYTDMEYNAKKYKFDNAIASTQAAVQEGILPGGGVALWNTSAVLEDSMFIEALQAPFMQMALNAGVDSIDKPQGGTGTNFKTLEQVDMLEVGIIDPHKVVRTALESAVAMTKQLIGFETAITITGNTDSHDVTN